MKQIFFPCAIYWTDKQSWLRHIKSLPTEKSILFISGRVVSRMLGLNKVLDELKSTHQVSIITKSKNIPTTKEIKDILEEIKEKPEIIVAVGGGSSIDIAKMIAAFWYLKDRDYCIEDILVCIKTKEYLQHNSNISIIAVPTTAGTGSEVTSWATLWDTPNFKKYSVDADHLYPRETFMIPEFTWTMPDRLTLATALDALCHATESYWAKDSNSITRELSKVAIKLIVNYLPKVLKDRENDHFRKKMALGSLYAGISFSQTRTTACHAISYPLTMKYGIEHGFACALTLAEIFKLNKEHIIEQDELLEAFNIKDIDELQTWIHEVSKNIVTLTLAGFNIKEEETPLIAKLSFTQDRMDNNPVSLSEEDICILLKKI